MEEIWKPIENYEDYYLISNFGQVRSLRTNKIMKHNIMAKDNFSKNNKLPKEFEK